MCVNEWQRSISFLSMPYILSQSYFLAYLAILTVSFPSVASRRLRPGRLIFTRKGLYLMAYPALPSAPFGGGGRYR